MKNLAKPYGVAFKTGMVLLAGCLIFVIVVAVFYADAYHLTTQRCKDNISELWLGCFILAVVLISVGSPTTPSKKE